MRSPITVVFALVFLGACATTDRRAPAEQPRGEALFDTGVRIYADANAALERRPDGMIAIEGEGFLPTLSCRAQRPSPEGVLECGHPTLQVKLRTSAAEQIEVEVAGEGWVRKPASVMTLRRTTALHAAWQIFEVTPVENSSPETAHLSALVGSGGRSSEPPLAVVIRAVEEFGWEPAGIPLETAIDLRRDLKRRRSELQTSREFLEGEIDDRLFKLAAKLSHPPKELPAPGVQYESLRPGRSSSRPNARDIVQLRYTARTWNGAVFSSTRGRVEEVVIKRQLPGLAQGLLRMSEGETARLSIPGELAFGGGYGMPRGPVIYEVELMDIVEARRPPPPPQGFAEPPPDARRTAGGVAFVILSTGAEHRPPPSEDIVVQYTGWSASGEVIDSSIPEQIPGYAPKRHLGPELGEIFSSVHPGSRVRVWLDGEQRARALEFGMQLRKKQETDALRQLPGPWVYEFELAK